MPESILHNFGFWLCNFLSLICIIAIIWFQTPSGKKWLREP